MTERSAIAVQTQRVAAAIQDFLDSVYVVDSGRSRRVVVGRTGKHLIVHAMPLPDQPAAGSPGTRQESVHAAVAPERGSQSASLAPGVGAAESGPPQVSSTDSLKETLA